MEASTLSHRIRFGKFEVDAESGELYKDGRRIRLQGAPEDSDFDLSVLIQLLVNLRCRLGCETIFADLYRRLLFFQHVLNVALHLGGYFAQLSLQPSFLGVCGFGCRISNKL